MKEGGCLCLQELKRISCRDSAGGFIVRWSVSRVRREDSPPTCQKMEHRSAEPCAEGWAVRRAPSRVLAFSHVLSFQVPSKQPSFVDAGLRHMERISCHGVPMILRDEVREKVTLWDVHVGGEHDTIIRSFPHSMKKLGVHLLRLACRVVYVTLLARCR